MVFIKCRIRVKADIYIYIASMSLHVSINAFMYCFLVSILVKLKYLNGLELPRNSISRLPLISHGRKY